MKLRLLVVVVLLSTAMLVGQTFRGTILGSVTDPSGAYVAGATVKVRNEGTGLERTTTTSGDGSYSLPELPLGSYSVTVTQTGFQTYVAKNVAVSVSAEARVDVRMTTGQVSQRVEVTADIPMIETTSNTLGGTIEAAQIADLPVNGRDFVKLATLVPGAGADANGDSDSPGALGTFSVNGNRGRANNYLLDGTDMNDGYRNDPAINEGGVFGTPATLLPTDAVAEAGLLSNMEAEYGRNSGGVMNIVTKSGTNTLHGSGFEYFRNNALDARNFFNCAVTTANCNATKQDPFHNNQFGGSLGGAIIKDETFYFLSYEGWRETGGIPTTSSVPTQAEVNAYTGAGGTINPVIVKLLARNPWSIPLPAGTDGVTPATVQVTDPFKNRVDSLIVKLDQHLHGGDLLTGRYFFGDSDQSFPLGLGGGSTVPGYNTKAPTRVQVVSVSYTHIWTPKVVMEARGGWVRFAEGFFPTDSNFDPNTIGMNTGVTGRPIDYGLPQITFSDGTSGLGGSGSLPRHRFDSNWQYFTNLSYTTGKHNIKFGYEFRRSTINQIYDIGFRGKLKFTSFAGDPTSTVPALFPSNSFLAGVPFNGGSQTGGNSHRITHENSHGFYIQDAYRVTPRLTLNLGLRWDYFGVINAQNHTLSLFNAAGDSLQQVGVAGGPSSLYPKDLNNFAPRFSVAYDLFGAGKTVVRMGWGLFYDAFAQDLFEGHAPFNTSNAGPAYNGIGPAAIQSASTVASPIPTNGDPIFGGFGNTLDAWTVDHRLRTPYVYNYNLNVEQSLGRNMAFTIGYVGSQGVKLFRFIDLNQHDPATPTVSPFPNFNIINQTQTSANSHYNSLQATWNLRNWRGVTSQLVYTLSHSIDTASDEDDNVPNAAQPDNSFNPAAEKANSSFDARHRFIWTINYALPNSSQARLLTNGWAIDGLLRITSGEPYNVVSFSNYNGTNEFMERPDVIGNPQAGVHAPYQFLNLSALAAPCDWDPVASGCVTGTKHFGNLRRNAFLGPAFHNFDFSLSKDTKLGEKVNMQFRADFFNIFNHPNFGNPLMPAFSVNLENNGTVAPLSLTGPCALNAASHIGCRAVGPGFLPIFGTPDVVAGEPFIGGGGARNIQLAVKFTF